MGEGKNKKIAMIVCVFLSFGLWLYVTNVENPSKSRNISNVHVDVLNINSLEEKGLILSPDQDFSVDVKIEAPANKIYSINAEDFKIQVDLDQYALKLGENNIPIEFINYPDGITIKNSNSLSLKIKVEKLKTKRVKVESKVNITYRNGYFEKSMDISPENIDIKGPEELVNKVTKAALTGEENDVSKDFSNQYNIIALDANDKIVEGVELSQEKGDLNVVVSSQKIATIKVKTVGKLKDGLILKSTSVSVNKLSIFGNNTSVNEINEIWTEDIDISNIDKTTTVKAKLIIPNGVEIEENINEVNVTFTIEETALENKVIKNVPINYIDKSDDYTYNYPETIDITISGKTEDIRNITNNDIVVEASLKNIVAEGTSQVEWTAKFRNNIEAVIMNPNGKVNVISKLKE